MDTAVLLDALTIGLRYGAALSAFMAVLIVASLRHNPLVWLQDAPPDVRERVGPVDDRTRRHRRAWGVVMGTGLVLLFGLLARETWPLGMLATFVAAFTCFEVFNLFDAVVIDLGLVLLKPKWAFPPGAEDSPSYTDPRWHLLNFAKGLVAGVPFGAAVVALTALVDWIAGWG